MGKLMQRIDSKLIAAKTKIDEIMSKEDGMETLETVIVVILAIVVAGGVITMIGKNSSSGLLKVIYDRISGAITDVFATSTPT